jgi:hypothetical protein
MRRALFSASFVFALAASLAADSNLHISDVGLHGYAADPAAVRLVLRNPLSRPQVVHLRVSASNQWGGSNAVTSEVSLRENEQLELELPLQATSAPIITADATASGAFFGHDTYGGPRGSAGNLIVLMCASESVCRTAQGQIQMSGSIENRADKNRETKIVTMADSREHWWAYSASNAVVLALPAADLTPTQRDALEGFLRSGGRLVLLEAEIADPTFLSAYRQTPPPAYGERVGMGTLFRVAGLSADTLGDVFAGPNLDGVIHARYGWSRTDWLLGRFGATFDFPRLRWVLFSMAAYILLIGILNFAVLRRLHRLEFGWISVCALACLFAAGIYFFSAIRRPKGFSLDSLATYYLDGQSPQAAVDYTLRVSAPERRDVLLSVSDPAVVSGAGYTGGLPNSQIWAEISQRTPQFPDEYDLHLGPPTQVELSMLKWSSRDLSLRGMRQLAGTVHFVAPDRLRNDTGQQFSASVYFDSSADVLYSLPPLAPGQEIQLDASTRTPISSRDAQARWNHTGANDKTDTLRDLALRHAAPFSEGGKVFAGLSDGPVLPVELDVPCQRNIHSLFVIHLERP